MNRYSLLGAALVLAAAAWAVQIAAFLASAHHVRGTVVDRNIEQHGRVSRPYHVNYPVVYFEAPPGTSRQVTGAADWLGLWRVGDVVDVVYPKGSPELARPGGFQNQWATPFYLAVAGLALLVLGRVRSRP